MKEKTKVISYIFRKNKTEVLVFLHQDFPEAGIQVVGGTLEPNEDHLLALVREIKEESGLDLSPELFTKIGETTYKRKDREELNFRHYFAAEIETLPDLWTHKVVSDGADNGLLFDFFWLPVEEAVEKLDGNFGELIKLP